uniref:Nutrient reservoir n=1 Tax=Solanum tuberosum TaxID=4113 RepID=M1DD13_SOLTU
MKATRRLGKDNDELKMLRQEREDDEKVHREMQMLEENAIERIMEMEQAFVNTNCMIETTNYGLSTLERYNVGPKKEMEALMLCTGVYAMNVNNALTKVQEAVKKFQAAEWRNAHLRRICLLSSRKKLYYRSSKRKPTRLCTSLRYFYSISETSLPS